MYIDRQLINIVDGDDVPMHKLMDHYRAVLERSGRPGEKVGRATIENALAIEMGISNLKTARRNIEAMCRLGLVQWVELRGRNDIFEIVAYAIDELKKE